MVDLGERYQVEDILGSGAFGRVYRARDTRLDRLVAVKEVPGATDNPEVASRLRREAEVACQVRHPNLVDLLDVGKTPAGVPMLVFELVPGRTLEEHLEAGSLPPAQVVAWVAQLADALAALHEAEVVHRDLKPANVLIHEDGRALLADLGLARADSDRTALTETGALVGTPLYMAPEFLRTGRDPGPAGDLFALGALAYRALYGEDWRDVDAVHRLLGAKPSPPGDTTETRLGRFPAHDPWLRGLLQEDPRQRLGPAARVAAHVRGESSSAALRPAPPAPPRKLRWLVTPALAVAGLLVGAYMAGDRGSPPEPDPRPAPVRSSHVRGDLEKLASRLPDFPYAPRGSVELETQRRHLLDAAFPLRLGRYLLGLQQYCSYGPPGPEDRAWLDHAYQRLQLLINAWDRLDTFQQGSRALSRGELPKTGFDEVRRLRALEDEISRLFTRYLEEAERSGRLGRSGQEDAVHAQLAIFSNQPLGPTLVRSLLRALAGEPTPIWRQIFAEELENLVVLRTRVALPDDAVVEVADGMLTRADRTVSSGDVAHDLGELERGLHMDLVRQQISAATESVDDGRDARYDEREAFLLAEVARRAGADEARRVAARLAEVIENRQGLTPGTSYDQPRMRRLATRWTRLRKAAGLPPPDLSSF